MSDAEKRLRETAIMGGVLANLPGQTVSDLRALLNDVTLLRAKLIEEREKARLDFIAWCNSETERVEAEDARDRYAREANQLEEAAGKMLVSAQADLNPWIKRAEAAEAEVARLKVEYAAAIDRGMLATAELQGKLAEAQDLLLLAYRSGHREGWEAGPTTDETMSRICHWLANEDLDPNLSREAKRRLRALRGEGEK